MSLSPLSSVHGGRHSLSESHDSMSESKMKRGHGSSCHQCKTTKDPQFLVFCTNKAEKGGRKRRCRKKYCESCLTRSYGPEISEIIPSWQCPSCLAVCICAACHRKNSTKKVGGGSGVSTPAGPGSVVSPGSCSTHNLSTPSSATYLPDEDDEDEDEEACVGAHSSQPSSVGSSVSTRSSRSHVKREVSSSEEQAEDYSPVSPSAPQVAPFSPLISNGIKLEVIQSTNETQYDWKQPLQLQQQLNEQRHQQQLFEQQLQHQQLLEQQAALATPIQPLSMAKQENEYMQWGQHPHHHPKHAVLSTPNPVFGSPLPGTVYLSYPAPHMGMNPTTPNCGVFSPNPMNSIFVTPSSTTSTLFSPNPASSPMSSASPNPYGSAMVYPSSYLPVPRAYSPRQFSANGGGMPFSDNRQYSANGQNMLMTDDMMIERGLSAVSIHEANGDNPMTDKMWNEDAWRQASPQMSPISTN